uniref:Transmembrane protein n=1 Tax=Panagrolaimus sp. JU765 TaxID=591449 RepID=A0AC34QMM4_9BILA
MEASNLFDVDFFPMDACVCVQNKHAFFVFVAMMMFYFFHSKSMIRIVATRKIRVIKIKGLNPSVRKIRAHSHLQTR